MRARLVTLSVVVLGFGLLPSSAVAERCTDGDVAAVDQYCDTLPGAGGITPIDSPGATLETTLPRRERIALTQSAATGRALLALPPGSPGRGRRSAVKPLPGAADALSGRLESDDKWPAGAVKAVGNATSEGGGLSELFRSLLLISTVGLAGTAWLRRGR